MRRVLVAVLVLPALVACSSVDEAVDGVVGEGACAAASAVVDDIAGSAPLEADQLRRIRDDALALAEVLSRLPGVDLPTETIDEVRAAGQTLGEAADLVGVDPAAARAQVDDAVDRLGGAVSDIRTDLSC
jgi:hypothetical protein